MSFRTLSFKLKEDNDKTYIHAKLYLIKTKSRAICLQGSPNLSQAAMLLTPPIGNIELANLIEGGPDDFDDLFENLQIDPETPSLHTLDLRFRRDEEHEGVIQNNFMLLGGTWQADLLTVRYQGNPSTLTGIHIRIGNEIFVVEKFKQADGFLELQIPNEAKPLLASAKPVTIIIPSLEAETNPIYICHSDSLNREMLGTEAETGDVVGIGNLDLGDEDFERLLGELEAVTVIDRRSVWQMAGKSLPKNTGDDDQALRLDYADIDYEQLKKHPRILPYLSGHEGYGGLYSAKSRLQLILTAITDHFNGLVEIGDGQIVTKFVSSIIPDPEEEEAETEDEREELEKEKLRRHRSAKARIRQILKNFIRRYIRGIRSPDFQELAGPEVMAKNYVIFSHLLWRLFAKDWVETDFILESCIKIWSLAWGTGQRPGYFSALSNPDKTKVIELLREQHSDALLLATVYYGWHSLKLGGKDDTRFFLRDFIRDLLTRKPFPITQEIILDSWRYCGSLLPYNPPIPGQIIADIEKLANFQTRDGFLREIEISHNYPEGSCSFERKGIYREHRGVTVETECLVINDEKALENDAVAYAITREWSRYHPNDCYRIMTKDNSRIFFFDTVTQNGFFYKKDPSEDREINHIPALSGVIWETAIDQLKMLAKIVDDEVTFKIQISNQHRVAKD